MGGALGASQIGGHRGVTLKGLGLEDALVGKELPKQV